ncbi:nucleoside 2-deoxyribosyltransferase [Spiroplasma endosymbiont of Othius punctulatus]|uniref:nucleoside 2-deoxyribosyltransferase n=1 Tax=Spiroplasma endosymbiont of Othius punctulatus TaxID=3066289 RepID=UPI0030D1343B
MRNNKKYIYNAGSMFNEAQQTARKNEGNELRKMFPSFIIDNPIDTDEFKHERPTNKKIFEVDYNGVRDADFVIFELDSNDSGTHMEFGLAVEQAINNKDKYLFAIVSDFRFKSGSFGNEIPGFGLNEMFSGAFFYEQLVKGEVPQIIVCDSHKSAREAIKAIVNNDTKDYLKRFDIKNIWK